MPKFTTEKVFKLDFLGELWKDCFIKFTSVSVKQNRALLAEKTGDKAPGEIQDITTKFFVEHFISGSVYDDETKEIIAMKPEWFEELPSLVQQKMILFLISDAS